MRKIVLLFVLISGYAFSQSINDYQYIIVPAKFTDFKAEGKFSLNLSTKLLLQKYGFKAFLTTDSIPDEIANSSCKKLYADLVSDNGILTTKVKIVIKDCREKIVYETAFGSSREKELPIAYNFAFREAAKSFEKLNYKYNGKNDLAETLPVAETKTIEIGSQKMSETPISSEPTNSNDVFYFAQPTATGYQVVDTEPKIIMKLFNTSQKNVFMAVKGDVNGTVISKNGEWFFEYYANGKLVSELLKLKF